MDGGIVEQMIIVEDKHDVLRDVDGEVMNAARVAWRSGDIALRSRPKGLSRIPG